MKLDYTRRTFITGFFGLSAIPAIGSILETKKIIRMEKLWKRGEYFRFEYGPFDPVRLLPADGHFDVDPGLDTMKRAEIFKDLVNTIRGRLSEAEFTSDMYGVYNVATASESFIETAAIIFGVMKADSSVISDCIADFMIKHPSFNSFWEYMRAEHRRTDNIETESFHSFLKGNAFTEYIFKQSDLKCIPKWISLDKKMRGSHNEFR